MQKYRQKRADERAKWNYRDGKWQQKRVLIDDRAEESSGMKTETGYVSMLGLSFYFLVCVLVCSLTCLHCSVEPSPSSPLVSAYLLFPPVGLANPVGGKNTIKCGRKTHV